MKKDKYLGLFIIIIVGFIYVACNINTPTIKQVTPESSLDLLLEYFPTLADTPFVYINDQSGEKYHLSPCRHSGMPIYPRIAMLDEDGEDLEVPPQSITNIEQFRMENRWSNEVSVYFLPNGFPPHSMYTTWLIGLIKSVSVDSFMVNWNCFFKMNDNDNYSANYRTCYDAAQVWNYHTDTLVFQVKHFPSHSDPNAKESKSYVRIVKGQGIYDFSIDNGQSVWRRVK